MWVSIDFLLRLSDHVYDLIDMSLTFVLGSVNDIIDMSLTLCQAVWLREKWSVHEWPAPERIPDIATHL